MRKRVFFGAVLAAAAFCGCSNFIMSPYFTVKDSGLNWVSIRYYQMKTTPIQRVNVRIDGNGMVSVKEGASSLVSNDFAAKSGETSWGDIRATNLTLSPEEVLPIFQMLVDKGLFKDRIKGKSTTTNEAIFASANIDGKACGSEDDIYGIDPDLADHLKMVVMMFYHPQPKQRR